MPDSPAPNSVQLSMPNSSVASVVSSPVSSHPPSSAPSVHDGRPITSINPSIINGHPTSPNRPLSPGMANGNQLPPTCGARQLSKLKRFLTTLQQFGSDISPEIGERVRSLIVSLVVSKFAFLQYKRWQQIFSMCHPHFTHSSDNEHYVWPQVCRLLEVSLCLLKIKFDRN